MDVADALLHIVHGPAPLVQVGGQRQDDVIERVVPLGQQPHLQFQDEEQFLEPLPAPLDAEDVLVFGAGDEFDQLVVEQEIAAEAPIRPAAGERGVVVVAVHAVAGLLVVAAGEVHRLARCR